MHFLDLGALLRALAREQEGVVGVALERVVAVGAANMQEPDWAKLIEIEMLQEQALRAGLMRWPFARVAWKP